MSPILSSLPGLLFAALSLVAVQASSSPKAPQVHQIYEFPNNTWIENVAERSNGQLLVTIMSNSPEIYQIDPKSAAPPRLVATIPGVTGALGITEISPDVFAVIGSKISLATVTVEPKSNTVWKMAFDNTSPSSSIKFSKIADLPEANFLNGLAALPSERGSMLLTDSALGVVWKLNADTGAYKIIQDSPLMKPVATGPLRVGVNGLRIDDSGKLMVFSNSNSGTIVSVPLAADGSAAGPYKVEGTLGSFVDDLALLPDGKDDKFLGAVYTTNINNSLGKVSSQGVVTTILGGQTEPTVAGCTSALFSRTEGGVLYVVTSGGMAAPAGGGIVGGKILRIDLGTS